MAFETRSPAHSKFKTGAIPSPRHVLASATPFQKSGLFRAPPQAGYFPRHLDPWGNDRYGDCVTAEEAFAKACCDPEIFIDAQTVIQWASKHGWLNGAMLTDVMDNMINDGFRVGNQQYNDGRYKSVDYSNQSILQSALSDPSVAGPIKIAIDHSALPDGAGNHQGWYALGRGNYRDTDHCVSVSAYGPAGWFYQQLGVQLPSGLSSNQLGYGLYTWSTIGFVDHDWLMGTCVEGWVRMPTTVGVPPLPGPGPGPDPVPVPGKHCLQKFQQELSSGVKPVVAAAHLLACLLSPTGEEECSDSNPLIDTTAINPMTIFQDVMAIYRDVSPVLPQLASDIEKLITDLGLRSHQYRR